MTIQRYLAATATAALLATSANAQMFGEGYGTDLGPDEFDDDAFFTDTYTLDEPTTEAQRRAIRAAKENKDTIGGIVEAHVFGCPIGIGTSMNWYEKIDSRIGAAVMGIQAFKGVEIGLGFEAARRPNW